MTPAEPPHYRCSWCLEDRPTANAACPCCGVQPGTADGSCEHRTKSTINDLFRAGVRLVRRDPWADGNYLELLDIGGFLTPFGLVHSPLEWQGTAGSVRLGAQQVPLWMTPSGGWEPYLGVTVEEGDARSLPPEQRRSD